MDFSDKIGKYIYKSFFFYFLIIIIIFLIFYFYLKVFFKWQVGRSQWLNVFLFKETWMQ